MGEFVSAENVMQMNIQQLEQLLQSKTFPVRAVMQRLQQLSHSLAFMNTNKKNLLHFAAEEGDSEAIKALLEAKVFDVNDFENESVAGSSNTSLTALNYACRNNHFEAVKLLVAAGADVKIRAQLNMPIIQDSIQPEGTEIFDYLLELGVDVKDTSAFDFNCLDIAARQGNIVLLDRLLAMGFDPYRKSISFHTTILHLACMGGKSVPTIKRIMDMGLNPFESCVLRRTPIGFLIMKGTRETLGLMMSYGVVDVHNSDALGETPLFKAVLSSNIETARLLLEAGSNPNRPHAYKDLLPLQAAVDEDDPEMILLLLSFGAYRNSRNGDSLMMRAVMSQKVKAVDGLCRGGVDVNSKSIFSKMSPLNYACAIRDVPIINKLIDYGANLNALDVDGYAPLHKAAMLGQTDIVYALLQRGANANAKDRYLRSPLDYENDMPNEQVRKMLIDGGAQEITCGSKILACLSCFFFCCSDK